MYNAEDELAILPKYKANEQENYFLIPIKYEEKSFNSPPKIPNAAEILFNYIVKKFNNNQHTLQNYYR